MSKLKQKLSQSITDQIDKGRFLLTQTESVADMNTLDSLILTYERWDEENKHLLKSGFTKPFQQYYSMYAIGSYLGNTALGEHSFEVKRERLLRNLPKKNTNLTIALNALEQIPHTALLPVEPLHKSETNLITNNAMKKIFISHSSLDAPIVKHFIELLEVIGIKPEEIFFSSHPDYGVGLGENILERLKKELSTEIMVMFIFSDNFFNSPVCLCEMGATWIKTNEHIPVLIPPFDFNKVKGVFPNSLGMKITDEKQLNSLKEKLESKYGLKPITLNRWEEKRKKCLEEMEYQISISRLDIERREKEVMAKINSSGDKRISRADLKAIIGQEPVNPQTVGTIELKQVYLNSQLFMLKDS